MFPSSGYVLPEPLGCALIIGTCNYPIHLLRKPLAGAIATGNCSILKPGELAANSSRVLAKLIAEQFDPSYITVVQGDGKVTRRLLDEKIDSIFFYRLVGWIN